jgi:sterol desaturase/sphingolipid hydroxylase (fatty acid hydroxylase superfamily)
MLNTLFILVMGFFFGECIGYFIHRMLHTPLGGTLHQKHMTHHQKLYPTTDFFSEKYRSAGKDNTVFTFAVLIAGACALLFVFFSLRTALIVSGEFLVLGLLNDYLHDIFHIKPNWLEKYAWFQRLLKVHYRHHEDMGTNYGIFSFLGDRLFGTYSE